MDAASRAILEVMVAQTPGAHVADVVDRYIVPREVMRMLESFQYRICVIDFDEGVEECCRIAQRLRDNCDKSINLFATSLPPAGLLTCASSNPSAFPSRRRNSGIFEGLSALTVAGLCWILTSFPNTSGTSTTIPSVH